MRNIQTLYKFLKIKLLYYICSTSLVQRGCDFRYKQESINRELNIMISLIDEIKLRPKENKNILHSHGGIQFQITLLSHT